MSWRDLVRDAASSLAAHRARSVLCGLGLLTGVAAVVVACAIANGAERQAVREIGALGVHNVIVRSAAKPGTAPALSLDDVEDLAAALPRSAVAARRSLTDTSSDRRLSFVAGVTPAWRRAAAVDIAEGRWFHDRERSRTAVLGALAAGEFFGGADAIGQECFIAGEWRTVVGVLTVARGVNAGAGDLARAALVPFDTLDLPLGKGDDGRSAGEIVIRATDDEDVGAVARHARATLLKRHEADTFDVVVPRELLAARLRSQRTFRAVLLAIGGLSLLVAGVGIANIMLASVLERTAEIGVRRAVGARRALIVRQFAAEAALLGIAGGLAGLPAGAAGAAVIAWTAGWPIALSPLAALGACLSAAVIGLTAGIYPARAAAAVAPIEALRQ